jgi:hypothetical protein
MRHFSLSSRCKKPHSGKDRQSIIPFIFNMLATVANLQLECFCFAFSQQAI